MKCKNLEQIFQILNLHPEREFKFHKTRCWRLDFAFSDFKIAIEYEGIFSKKSRHLTPAGFSNDCEKYNELSMQGWVILRFTAIMVNDGRAFEQIERALK